MNITNIDYIIAAKEEMVSLRAISTDLGKYLGGSKRSQVPFLFYTGKHNRPELLHLHEIGIYVGNRSELASILANTHIIHQGGQTAASKVYAPYASVPGSKIHFRARGFGDRMETPYSALDKIHLETTKKIEVRASDELSALLHEAIPKVVKSRSTPKTMLGRVRAALKKEK